MSTYKSIKGESIVGRTSNFTSPSTEGQVFYNTTDNVFKTLLATAAWNSGGNLSSARGFVAHTGTQTASLLAGGLSPAPTYFTATEEYNGSGWSTGGSLPAATYGLGGAGTQTAALIFGGANSSDTKQSTTYTYDGTSYTTTPNSLNTARDQLSGGGTQTSALAVGGRTSSAMVTNMEEWNGSTWTNLSAIPEGRGYSNANGPETAFFIASGATGNNAGAPYASSTLNYDGSSISTGANVNTARSAGGAAGDSANAIFYGGDVSGTSQTKTEKYDGTSWSEVADMAVAKRGSGAGAGTSNAAALSAGAYGPPVSGSTEEFNSSLNVTTAAAWASGGAMTTARTGLASAGTQTANVFIGGQMSNSPYAPLNTVELYNGTSWSTNPNNAPYSASNNCGTGTQTAALSWGGYPNITTTLEFDGSAFTSGGSLSTGRELTSSNIGTQTAAVAAGGFVRPGTYPAQSEEYNGSAWTAGGNLNTSGYGRSGAGTETAGLVSGGIEPGQLNATEEYNGTAWTSVNNRPYSAGNAGTSGTQTDALYYGGNPGGALTTTLGYDGTNWSTRPSMAQARAMMGSSAAGTGSSALASSGAAPTATEEFTGETTAVTASTISTS